MATHALEADEQGGGGSLPDPSSSLGRLAAPSQPRSRPQTNAPPVGGGGESAGSKVYARGPPAQNTPTRGRVWEQRLTDTPRGPEDGTGAGVQGAGVRWQEGPSRGGLQPGRVYLQR